MKLEEVLLELGFVTPEQLSAGLTRQAQEQRRLGEVLVSMGLVAEDKLVKALQRQTGVEEWDPKRSPVHQRVIAMFPARLAIEHRVFPVAIRKNNVGVTWCVATTDPTDEATRQALGTALCTPDEPVRIIWFVSTRSIIEAAIEAHYPPRAPEPEILIEDPVDHSAEASISSEEAPARLARIRVAKKEGGKPQGERD